MTPDFRALLADDAYAASFQSMGQYRTALLKALATPPPEPLRPIPLSERLPGPEDCLFNTGATIGSCWIFNPIEGAGGIAWWSFEPLEWNESGTHWLPANAIPHA
jgi:hypothetical protein